MRTHSRRWCRGRRCWFWLLLVGLLLTCNLPLTPLPGTPVGTEATLTAIFAQVPTLVPTIRAATATPVRPRVITPTPASLPTPPGPLRQGGTVVAPRRSSPILIDGRLDDWPELPYEAAKVVYGEDAWDGPQDLSARFALAWDEDALYVAVQVTDDVYAQAATGFYLFQGDEVEVLVDRDLFGDFTVNRLNGDDYSLGLSPGRDTPGSSAEAYLWFPQGLRGPRPQVVLAAQSNGLGQGYNLEARIPWEVFGSAPQPGTYLGFALRVSDNDLPGERKQQSMVANVPPPHRYDRPNTWGNLLLGR